jgi:hypothetical protein
MGSKLHYRRFDDYIESDFLLSMKRKVESKQSDVADPFAVQALHRIFRQCYGFGFQFDPS